MQNPYIDINYVDRTEEVEAAYQPTLEDIKRDPEFYAELVNDLMFHWVHGTRETPLMFIAKQKNSSKSIVKRQIFLVY